MRRIVALLCVAAATGAAGCGLGAGEEQEGDGVQLRVTRDFGRTELGAARLASVREDETVMRVLRSRFEVETRFGGRFVQSIDGLEGGGAGGEVDWFYFVNGVEAEVGAAEFELSPGDRVQWDRRDWGATMRVPAIVGAFPEPFLHGLEGKRRPVRVECEDSGSSAARPRATGSAPWGCRPREPRSARPGRRAWFASWSRAGRPRGSCAARRSSSRGRRQSGVFARFARDGSRLDLLDARGEPARTVRPGEGVGLVLALAPRAGRAALARDRARRARRRRRGARAAGGTAA